MTTMLIFDLPCTNTIEYVCSNIHIQSKVSMSNLHLFNIDKKIKIIIIIMIISV